MITIRFISKSDESVAVVAAKPRVQALARILPRPISICDLLDSTKQLSKIDRRYELASVMAVILLSTAIVFVVLNYASSFHP
ncbi:MAG: hypothetical protein JO077_16850 [Verrucomicrobia bacterium]|nr:hypothetical protein [Verrucomicrobiota bacterium]